jgi:NAD(P)-dependent dehydrogenase (short-subunit alcohol dehydrogenase family)
MSLLSQPFDPEREAAMVTGAGNGIGRAIALALVGEGVKTVFADISKERGTRRSRLRRGPSLRCLLSAISDNPPHAMRCLRTPKQRSAASRILCTALPLRGAKPITSSP